MGLYEYVMGNPVGYLDPFGNAAMRFPTGGMCMPIRQCEGPSLQNKPNFPTGGMCQPLRAPTEEYAYFNDPMFYINAGIGLASIEATIKGGYHLSNDMYHYTRSSGRLHFKGGRYWENNITLDKSRAAIEKRGGAWRQIGTKLGYAGIAVTTGDAILSGEVRASQGINIAVTAFAIGVPGVGSIVAGLYFVTDFGLTLTTGRGIGDRIDSVTGGTYHIYRGLY